MFASGSEALQFISKNNVAMVDLKIVTISGRWLHVTIPARGFGAKHFEEGVGYDGSSGAGFASIESGDVAAMPQPSTAFIDPFWEQDTISFLCDTVAADTKKPFHSDPRTIAKRAVDYMRHSGVAHDAMMGPEFEFHVFDRVEVINEPFDTGVSIRSSEVHPDGIAVSMPAKQGYMSAPPTEMLHDLRSEVVTILEAMNVPVRYHHHEVGAPGQCEIEVALGDLVEAADRAMLIKYVVKNVARRRGKLATFMPKPVFSEAGNGMHVHQHLVKEGRNLFFDEEKANYANLSDLALHYTGGLLQHGRALTGLTNPSTNSFKRLVEGYEAPVNLFFSLGNRSAAVRVPAYAVRPEEKRIEYRPGDFTCNTYLALAAMLMAGLDGIATEAYSKPHSFGPFDVDITQQDEAFKKKITPIPHSLPHALSALREDHEFLIKSEVFSESFINGWIAGKRAGDVIPVASRPHPYEYQLYLDT
ncbi:MAG: type I glutamate--ammonia ligase [Phycisphaerales bacterium]|nr:MAG: type I glutamate--ammonia ligase [Phycisphaerales bacterium]